MLHERSASEPEGTGARRVHILELELAFFAASRKVRCFKLAHRHFDAGEHIPSIQGRDPTISTASIGAMHVNTDSFLPLPHQSNPQGPRGLGGTRPPAGSSIIIGIVSKPHHTIITSAHLANHMMRAQQRQQH